MHNILGRREDNNLISQTDNKRKAHVEYKKTEIKQEKKKVVEERKK